MQKCKPRAPRDAGAERPHMNVGSAFFCGSPCAPAKSVKLNMTFLNLVSPVRESGAKSIKAETQIVKP